MRQTAKYSQTDYKINKDILKELKTKPTLDRISKYKNIWFQHVDRMQRKTPQTSKKLHTPGNKELRRTIQETNSLNAT
jgi:hypothetical protein